MWRLVFIERMVTATTRQQAVLQDHVRFLFEKLAFEPTEAQRPIIECDARFILVTGGEQAGKSLIAEKYLLKRLPEAPAKALYWLVGLSYENTRREFEYLVDDLGMLGLLKKATKPVNPGRIELVDGTVIKTKSADDPRSLAMEAPDGIVVCEASTVDQETYWRCRGRVGPKRGWLFMAGTLEGSLGWYPGLAEAWRFGTKDGERSFKLPSWTNLHLYPGGREDQEIKRIENEAPDEWFMERMGGEASPPKGAVFANYFRPHIHIRDIEWDPQHPVRLWIDPGYAGAHAIEVVQIVNDVVYVFDEVYEQMGTEDMIDICKQRPWWKLDQMVPGVIDVYAYQHHALNVTPAEVWLKQAGLHFGSNKVKIQDGIDRFKSFLKPHPVTGEPKIVFSPRCKGILSEFGANPNPFDHQTRVYRWKINRDGTVVGDKPEDKYNHGIKAITYGLVDQFGVSFVGSEKIRVGRY